MGRFAEHLHEAAKRVGAPLCLGLDPFPDRIPGLFGQGFAAVRDFCTAMIEVGVGETAALKPQLGLFEPFGAEGFALARELCLAGKASGVPVILDAKRGDIGTTAEGYARAALGAGAGFDADCVTVNPYMGLDSLEPFLAEAEARGKGVAVLVRTSNPGARDLQDLDVGGVPLWRRVADMLAPAEARLAGAARWSDLMIVAGATWPDEARALRAALPKTLFLVPGYGAQGASAADAAAGLVEGEGGAINASRSLLYPKEAAAASDLASWREAIRHAMRVARAEIAAAL
jgi:orotidine-5'-phosphate decarboxylase